MNWLLPLARTLAPEIDYALMALAMRSRVREVRIKLVDKCEEETDFYVRQSRAQQRREERARAKG